MPAPEPVRLAMVGAGWWAWTAHLPSMRAAANIELVAVCDPDRKRAAAAAAEFGGNPSTDLDATLRDVTLDGVVVATPHHTHQSVVAAALEADRHVLVEKPMVLRAVDAWKLVETARRRSLHLSVGLTYQYADAAVRLRDAVTEEIGDLVCVNADFPSGTAALFARTDPDQDHLDDPASPHGTTFSDPATGGGQAYSQLTHVLGAVCFAARDQAVDVAAMTAHHGFAVDAVDALTFRLSRGALGVASSTATTPAGVSPGQPVRFHGTAGTVEWDLATGTGTIKTTTGMEHVGPGPGSPAYPRERVVSAFAQLIAGDGPNLGPADAAAAAVALIDAALESARSRTVATVTQGRLDPYEHRGP